MESYPHSFESGPHEPERSSDKKEDSSSSPKFIPWKPGIRSGAPVERVSGETSPKAESFLRSISSPESHENRESVSREAQDVGRTATEPEVEHPFERSAEARHAEEAESRKAEDEEVKDPDATSPKKNSLYRDAPGARTEPLSKQEWQELSDLLSRGENRDRATEPPDAFTEIIEREMPEAFVEHVSGEALTGDPVHDKEAIDLSDEMLAETPVVLERVESPRAELPAVPDALAEHPEVAADHREAADFASFLHGHPELSDLAAPAAEATPPTEDESFRRMVMSEGEPDPGPVAWHETEPGEPPTPAGGGEMPPGGPSLPTAEGGAFGPGETPGEGIPLPDRVPGAWAPAGDIMNPAVLAGITALEAQRSLDNLRHTAREAGLAGAVTILGVGLVLEHFGSKRRDRRLQRQIKAQGKELRQTNEALTAEQAAHLRTRAELQRSTTAQQATNETVRRLQQQRLPKVEKMAAAGAITGELAAAELAKRRRIEQVESARLTQREATLSPQSLGMESRDGYGTQVLPEVMSTQAMDNVGEQASHERLRDKVADTISPGTQTARDQYAPSTSLPPITPQAMNTQVQTNVLTQEERHAQIRQQNLLTSRWTWTIVGLLVVAVILSLIG